MKFGYFANVSNPRLDKPYSQILNEIRDLAENIENAGWDSIWFTEHHFGHEGFEVCSNAIMMCADIAARTTKLRLGQAANIVTFWNPLRFAEDIAMLDHMREDYKNWSELSSRYDGASESRLAIRDDMVKEYNSSLSWSFVSHIAT